MWFAGLRRRLRMGARIIHPDGTVTECLLLMDTEAPPFGVAHVAIVVLPFGVAVDKKVDQVAFDWLPKNTTVKIVSLTEQKLAEPDEASEDAL